MRARNPRRLMLPPSPLSPPQAALDKLPGELKEQQANAAAVERRLQREKGAWVVEEGRDKLPREFVQASTALCSGLQKSVSTSACLLGFPRLCAHLRV